MNYPIILLDFEASSLSKQSYPIEVGLAVALSETGPIHVWSRLIQPDRVWLAGGDWDPTAERTHNISAGDLTSGLAARQVAEALNAIIGPVRHAYSDAGDFDGFWLERLFKAARIEPRFEVWDLARILLPDRALFFRLRDVLAESAPPHRAGEDAARLCRALMIADGVYPAPETIIMDEAALATLMQ